jgi:hypothetical protein
VRDASGPAVGCTIATFVFAVIGVIASVYLLAQMLEDVVPW